MHFETYMEACALDGSAKLDLLTEEILTHAHAHIFYLSSLSRNIDRVDQTMDSIREQMDLTNEISDAISNPVGMGHDIDEVRF